jgi:hypothetical protein
MPIRVSDARTKSGTVPRSSAEQIEDRLAERALRRLAGRREKPFAAVLHATVCAVEADEMIDAVAVEEIGVPARPFPQPSVVFRGKRAPVVDRHAPVLPRRAEGVRRRADRHVEAELMLSDPHVGAVAVHHERQIAEHRNAVRITARLLPLRAGEPLQVLLEQHLGR